MSDIQLAVAHGLEPGKPSTADQNTHHHQEATPAAGGGGMMGSLRWIELQLVAFVMVFSAIDLVPLFDLVFTAITTAYLLLLSRLAFPGAAIIMDAIIMPVLTFMKVPTKSSHIILRQNTAPSLHLRSGDDGCVVEGSVSVVRWKPNFRSLQQCVIRWRTRPPSSIGQRLYLRFIRTEMGTLFSSHTNFIKGWDDI
ncbi:hypothetical protein L1987_11222 [Smallanthus sonchifolius]|uniref:Uncharacterized protein n=1 Tax=Smallanthus sonchifolius TaxID=185202 RepID=A0ACB9JAP9_9ASTR|nr:hypothetical protein L1987_11222 [Smallanthus sonchifolius]